MWEEFGRPLVWFLFNYWGVETLTARVVAEFFSWAIVSVFAAGVAIALFRKQWYALTRPVPVILTSLGILGTFSGVFLGLLDFNINIGDQESRNANFSELLEGLKVAFSTSILGLFLAVAFRFFLVTRKDPDEISGKDLYEIMERWVEATKDVTRAMGEAARATEEAAKATEKVAGATEEATSATKKVTRATEEATRATVEATATFRSFADDLAKVIKDQIFEALQEVIKGFDKTLTAEVGKSFEKLAGAVDRLVDWQENYKKQMDELKRSLDESLEGISMGARDLKGISESLAGAPENVKKVSRIIEAAHAHIADMERHLQTFAKLRDEVSGVFPEIQKNIAATNAGIKRTVGEQIKALNDASDEVDKNMSKRVERMNKDMAAQVETAIQELADYLSAVTQTQLNDFQSAVEGLRKIVKEAEKAHGDQG
ncbi:MAG: hypothetical protein MPL62_09460 [Alphaproteobacteria bacterium]|nr:hypothetical protein [Alphaproteobacteria bacterium]